VTHSAQPHAALLKASCFMMCANCCARVVPVSVGELKDGAFSAGEWAGAATSLVATAEPALNDSSIHSSLKGEREWPLRK